MTAENVGQTAGLSISGFTRWGAGPTKRERNFYIALGVALILHASFFIHAAQNGDAKRLGSEKGADDAISVSLVTEQDLQSRATIADAVTPPPGPPAPQQQAQPKPPPPQPQQPPQKQPPQPEEAKEEVKPEPQPPTPPTPPEPQPQAQEQPQPDTTQPETPEAADPAKPEQVAKQEDTTPDTSAPDLFSLDDQDPTKLQSESKPKAKSEPKPETKPETKKSNPSKSATKSATKAQKKKVADLDLSTQAIAPSFGGGGGAAFQRPPGITRSGLNDAFARAVIRALQQTMPQLNGALGRVTVRILLSESGNVVDVKLLNGAKDPSLNQDVVFAARQTSYPIPPAGSNLADRTFMVTYIYD
jgi:periplasmic protein TonB